MIFLLSNMLWSLLSWVVEAKGSTPFPSQILTFQVIIFFPDFPFFHQFPHGLPVSESFRYLLFLLFRFAVQPRSMDPSKDLAAYGYGSVAWKERMESWKQKQEKLQVMKNENGGKDWDNDGDVPELPL